MRADLGYEVQKGGLCTWLRALLVLSRLQIVPGPCRMLGRGRGQVRWKGDVGNLCHSDTGWPQEPGAHGWCVRSDVYRIKGWQY